MYHQITAGFVIHAFEDYCQKEMVALQRQEDSVHIVP